MSPNFLPATIGFTCLARWLHLPLMAWVVVSVTFLSPLMAAPPYGPDAWTMIWSDEFDGTAIDPGKWQWGALPWGGVHHNDQYHSYITPEDSYLASGSLQLRCRKIGKTIDGTWVPWTEGFVHSNGKFRMNYGYAEIRAKFATHKGTWPAFWMLADGWPPEIDVAELFGGEYYMHHGLASGTSSSDVQWDSTKPSADGAWNWNIWGIEWGPDFLRWYKNGVAVKTINDIKVPTQAMYFMLNSGMRAGWDASTPDPHVSQIDYLRVYKRSIHATNGDFEHGNAPWSRRNGAGSMAAEGVNGSAAMRILTNGTGDGAAEQSLYGLQPDTDYITTAQVRSNGWAGLRIGTKDHGTSETYQSRSSSAWGRVSTPFTTGPSATSARIYAYLPSAWATAYVDDLQITKSSATLNSSLETGELPLFWDTTGDVFIHDWTTYLRSGQHAMRFNNPNADRSVTQFIAGLKPSTVYRWSCWMRTHNQLLRLGVRDHGNSESSSGKTGLNWTWTRHQHDFTTGPSNTTASVFASIPAANRTSVVDVDDFFLAQPLPAGWTLSDIGDVRFPADAGVRNDRMVIMAGGDNLAGTADRLSFVHQSLTGNGTVTLRLRTIDPNGTAAKSGILLRESTAAGARHLFLGWRADGKNELARRVAPNGSTVADLTDAAAPSWMRLQRKGNVFTASISSNGSTWSGLGTPLTMDLPTTVLAGFAAVSGSASSLAEATASGISVVPDDADLDGMEDAWEMLWFGNLGQAAASDFDGDATSDLTEFRLGLDPTSGNSRFAVTHAGIVLTWPSAPGIVFEIRSSTDLADWSTLEATLPAAQAPAKTTSWPVPLSAGPIRFLRVQFIP